MPLINSNLAATWDGGATSLYSSQLDGKTVGYIRAAKDHHFGKDTDNLINALSSVGMEKHHRIALIGAGFGWAGERFIELGYENIVSTDTSQWIHANKAENAIIPIHDIDICTPEGRVELGIFDWAVTEDIFPLLVDQEAIHLSWSARMIAKHVAHWVSVRKVTQDPRLNWKYLGEWKQLVDPDWVIERGTAGIM
jgi:hypothetical protein